MTNRFPVPSIDSAIAVLRWSLVFIFFFFGTAKFALYEAEGVAKIASQYPLFSWMYPLWGPRIASDVIGTIELATCAALAIGAFSPRISLIGGLMGMCTFLITLSFSFGVPLWEEGYGFPFIGSLAQFLFKDAGLLAGCYAIAVVSARKAGLARD